MRCHRSRRLHHILSLRHRLPLCTDMNSFSLWTPARFHFAFRRNMPHPCTAKAHNLVPALRGLVRRPEAAATRLLPRRARPFGARDWSGLTLHLAPLTLPTPRISRRRAYRFRKRLHFLLRSAAFLNLRWAQWLLRRGPPTPQLPQKTHSNPLGGFQSNSCKMDFFERELFVAM